MPASPNIRIDTSVRQAAVHERQHESRIDSCFLVCSKKHKSNQMFFQEDSDSSRNNGPAALNNDGTEPRSQSRKGERYLLPFGSLGFGLS